ncbi:MAG: TolB family protein, partial [Thermoanaerobaculia bacterium]
GPGEEFGHIPASLGRARPGAARGPAPAYNFAGFFLPTQALQDNRAADHVPAQTHGALAVLHSHRTVCLYTWGHPIRGGDLWMVPLDGAGDPQAVLATNANEIIPQMSPDGKWLAYLSDRTGPYRIMVRPFPETGQREWVVSEGDAYDPRWSARGDALLYRQGIGRLMRVPIGGGDELAPGVAEKLIETDFHDAAGSSFAVSPDGKRVLVNKPVDASFLAETPVTLVTGWAGEVARVVGPN